MNDIPSGDNRGGAGCEGPHVRFCERPMIISWAYSMYARHGRHLYGESPEWGLASAYH